MDSVHSDGMSHPMVDRLSKIGKSSDDSNCHANLMNLLCSTCNFDAFISRVAEGAVTEIIKPSAIFTLVAAKAPAKFKTCFGAER